MFGARICATVINRMARLNLVVAMCNNQGIGVKGTLPWRLKGDMAMFRRVTMSTKDPQKQNAVIMGRKTWQSIPPKFRPLSKRLNIVLSREMKDAPEGAFLATSFPEAVEMATSGELAEKVESIFVIGGSSVYADAMKSKFDCRIILTRVLGDFECDTFLPRFDETEFVRVPNPDFLSKDKQSENGIDYVYEVYERANEVNN